MSDTEFKSEHYLIRDVQIAFQLEDRVKRVGLRRRGEAEAVRERLANLSEAAQFAGLSMEVSGQSGGGLTTWDVVIQDGPRPPMLTSEQQSSAAYTFDDIEPEKNPGTLAKETSAQTLWNALYLVDEIVELHAQSPCLCTFIDFGSSEQGDEFIGVLGAKEVESAARLLVNHLMSQIETAIEDTRTPRGTQLSSLMNEAVRNSLITRSHARALEILKSDKMLKTIDYWASKDRGSPVRQPFELVNNDPLVIYPTDRFVGAGRLLKELHSLLGARLSARAGVEKDKENVQREFYRVEIEPCNLLPETIDRVGHILATLIQHSEMEYGEHFATRDGKDVLTTDYLHRSLIRESDYAVVNHAPELVVENVQLGGFEDEQGESDKSPEGVVMPPVGSRIVLTAASA